MNPDTPVAVAAAVIAVGLLVADSGWLVTVALIALAALTTAGLLVFAIWRGRKAEAIFRGASGGRRFVR